MAPLGDMGLTHRRGCQEMFQEPKLSSSVTIAHVNEVGLPYVLERKEGRMWSECRGGGGWLDNENMTTE